MNDWSTEALPPSRQFSAWRHRLAGGRNPAHAERDAGEEAPFPARTLLGHIGSREILTIRAPAHRLELRPRDSLDHGDAILLFTYSHARVAIADRLLELPPGSLLLADPTFHGLLTSDTEIHYSSLSLSRRALDLHVDPARWLPGPVPLPGADPVGAMISSYMRSLLLEASLLTPRDGDIVLDALCRLLGLAIRQREPAPHPSQPSVRAARLARLKRIIAARLQDPELSPVSLADRVGVSPRNIHLLFEGSGDTFTGYVTSRRIEACRAMLSDPTQSTRSVADIAFELGFRSVSTFYRAFREAFATTPREIRTLLIPL